MKKIFLNLIAAGAAGWLMSASGQPATDNSADTNAPPPGMPPPKTQMRRREIR